MKDRFEAYDDIYNRMEELHESMLENDNKKVQEIVKGMRKDLDDIEHQHS